MASPPDRMETESGLRTRKKLRTRAALTSAAVRLFTTNGYEETTVEAIAAEAEVSPATFFRYFGSKDEAIFAERETYCTRMCRAIVDRPRDEDDLEAARHAVRAAFDDSVGLDGLRLQEQSVLTMPVLAGRLFAVRRGFEDAIAQALAERRGIDPPSLEVRLTAAMIMSAIAFAMRIWYEARQDEPTSHVIGEVFDHLVSVYGARSACSG